MFLSEKARRRFTPRRTRRAYDRVFSTQGRDIVLAHLADACHATESIASSNVNEMLLAEGRRQVWLLLQDMLRLTENDLREMQENVARMGEEDE